MAATVDTRVSDWLLPGEAALMLIIVNVGLRIIPYRTVRRLLERYGRQPVGDSCSIERVRRVAGAVTFLARRLPGATCLVQALAADALLRRHGCASELHIGVRRPDGRPKRLEGHAWIEYRGSVVVGGLDNLGDYVVMVAPRPSSPLPPHARS